MFHVSQGLMNDQDRGVIGLSEITLKDHRGSVMRRMGVRAVAELVRKAELFNLPRLSSGRTKPYV
jgi:FixJ family two-component response regulator